MLLPVWVQEFADSHRGQPLYLCRASDAQFQELGGALRSALTALHYSRKPISPQFAFAYVLYGALWISRNYEKGAWTWSAIDQTIGAAFDPKAHEALVEKGASYWLNGATIQKNGKRFLGYIMAQAGIPMKAIANESGWAAKGLRYLLAFLKRYPKSQAVLDAQIRSRLLDDKPDSFDPEHYCELLRRGAVSLAAAMSQLPSSPNDTEIEAAWKKLSDFPAACRVPLESFKALLRHYETDAEELSGECFFVRRFIRLPSGAQPQLVLTAKVRKTHASQNEMEALFPSLKSAHAHTASQYSAAGTIWADKRAFARISAMNDGTWRITALQNLRLTNADALPPVALAVKFANHAGGTAAAPLGASSLFDPHEPAVFIPKQNSDEWPFLDSGTVSTPADRVLILCPVQAEVQPLAPAEDDEKVQKEGGDAQAPFRIVSSSFLKIGGTTLQLLEAYESLRIRIQEENEAEAAEYAIRLRGIQENLSAWFCGEYCGRTEEGLPIYRGLPDIAGKADDIRWRVGPRGHFSTGKPVVSSASVCTARVARGMAVRRLRALILPHGASKQFSFGSSVKPGIITLSGWGALDALPNYSAVTAEKQGANIVLTCAPAAAESDCRPFSVLFCNAANGSHFTLSFEYPQRFLAVRFGKETSGKHIECSLDEVRRLTFAVVDPQSRGQRPEYLMMDAETPPKELQDPKRCRLWVPLYLQDDDHAGRLVYEDFRDELFRLMRLDAGSPKGVSLKLAVGNEQICVRVRRFSERMKYEPAEDAIRFDNFATYHTVCLQPLVADSRESQPFILEAGPGDAINLTQHAAQRRVPWVVYALQDERCRIRPLVIPPTCWRPLYQSAHPNPVAAAPEGAEAAAPTSASVSDAPLPKLDEAAAAAFPLLQIRSIWTKEKPTPHEKDYAEYCIRDALFKPQQPQRAVFEAQLRMLGARAFAFLPFWDALNDDVPLAFAFALSFDLTMPPAADGRSLAFSVGRYHAWRWDLISIRELGRILSDLQSFLKNRLEMTGCQASAEAVNHWLVRLLSLDIATFMPVLRDRLLCTLVKDGRREFTPELGREMQPLPYFALCAQRPADEKALQEKLKESAKTFVPEIRIQQSGQEASLAPDALALLEKVLSELDPEGWGMARRIFLNQTLSPAMRENQYMLAVLLANFAWVRGYDLNRQAQPDLLRRLAGKVLFFYTETLFAANSRWTAFCASFAEACAEVLRSASSKGRGIRQSAALQPR